MPTIELIAEVELLKKRAEMAENKMKGVSLFLRGEKYRVSTGIHDGPTYGYGELDYLGYWQYPVPESLVELKRAREKAEAERDRYKTLYQSGPRCQCSDEDACAHVRRAEIAEDRLSTILNDVVCVREGKP